MVGPDTLILRRPSSVLVSVEEISDHQSGRTLEDRRVAGVRERLEDADLRRLGPLPLRVVYICCIDYRASGLKMRTCAMSITAPAADKSSTCGGGESERRIETHGGGGGGEGGGGGGRTNLGEEHFPSHNLRGILEDTHRGDRVSHRRLHLQHQDTGHRTRSQRIVQTHRIARRRAASTQRT